MNERHKHLHIINVMGKYVVQSSDYDRPNEDDEVITTGLLPTFAHTLGYKERAEEQGVLTHRWKRHYFPFIWHRKIKLRR